jgi:MarR family 2-MHQ and catechol resistance regulon transcriptional repressor
MAAWTSKQARKSEFIPVMREMVRCYQAFERFDAKRLADQGLTTSQADVIFTLGNTLGMTCKELGERTLITKGTLTGVLDRLERKQLIRRHPSPEDRRSTIIVLTARGAQLFEEVYPAHISSLKECFDPLSSTELQRTGKALSRIRALFE